MILHFKVTVLGREEKENGKETTDLNVKLELSYSTRPGTLIARLAHLTPSLVGVRFLMAHNSSSSSSFSLIATSGDLFLIGPLPTLSFIKLLVAAYKLDKSNESLKVAKLIRVEIILKNQNRAELEYRNEAPIMETEDCEIQVPLGKWLGSSSKIKIFQVKAKNVAYFVGHMESNSIIDIDPSNGWISLNGSRIPTMDASEEVRVVGMSDGIKSRVLRLRFNFIYLSEIITIEVDRRSNSVLVNLNSIFPNTFRLLEIDSKKLRCNNCIKYEPISGDVLLIDQEKLFHEFEVKLGSADSDLVMALIKVTNSPPFSQTAPITTTTTEIFVSKNLGLNSVLFTSNQPMISLQHDPSFALDSSRLKLVLRASLAQSTHSFIEIYLAHNISFNQNLVLRVYLIENYLETVNFDRALYNFRFNTAQIGRVRLSSYGTKLISIDSIRIENIRCLTNEIQINPKLFSINLNGNDFMLEMNQSIFMPDCSKYSMQIKAFISSSSNWRKTISTRIVAIMTKSETKDLFNKNLKSVYHVSSLPRSFISVDLFNLINFSRSDSLYFKIVSEMIEIDVDFNQINGLILIRFVKSQIPRRAEFLVAVCGRDDLVLVYFELHLLLSPDTIFSQRWFKREALVSQRDAFVDERHLILDFNELVIREPTSFRLISPPSLFNIQDTVLYFDTNIARRFFVNFTQLLVLESCIGDYCEKASISIQMKFARRSFLDYTIEYYSMSPIRIPMDVKRNLSVKLRHFGENKFDYELNSEVSEECRDLELNLSMGMIYGRHMAQCENDTPRSYSLWINHGLQIPISFYKRDSEIHECEFGVRSINCLKGKFIIKIARFKII